MNVPEGKVEAPWEGSIRVANGGFIVSWYIQLDGTDEYIYRLEETPCDNMIDAVGVLTDHLGEYPICAYNTKTHELVEKESDD